ncbi:MAG: CoA pyrophosphatase [Paludibacter sp.]|nr:CoA pyrophosphatase [Paludibacter sp.]
MKLTPEFIRQKLSDSLPGLSSHLKMAPASRAKEMTLLSGNFDNAKKSAVMILLFQEDNRIKVIFIRRSNYVGIHAGQIAFPGGRFEESDVYIENTALREIEEEIGITPDKIEVLGRLTDIYVPTSNFLICVFVGFINQKPKYTMNVHEVSEIIELDLMDFFKEDIIDEKEFVIPSDHISVIAQYYKVGTIELWGASAMVMTELIDIIRG